MAVPVTLPVTLPVKLPVTLPVTFALIGREKKASFSIVKVWWKDAVLVTSNTPETVVSPELVTMLNKLVPLSFLSEKESVLAGDIVIYAPEVGSLKT